MATAARAARRKGVRLERLKSFLPWGLGGVLLAWLVAAAAFGLLAQSR